MSVVTAAEINTFFDAHFPASKDRDVSVTAVGDGMVTVVHKTTDQHLRVGGFILGPVQMALADHAAYIAIFTQAGITPMAMTSNLNIDFLRPAQGPDLRAEARIIKLGHTLALIAVELYAGTMAKPCSRATATFIMPKAN